MKKFIEIDGIYFEVQRQHIACGIGERMKQRTLEQCYNKPSMRKKAIYSDWWHWSKRNDLQLFGVRSYNTNVFTLECLYITANDGNMYYLEITPCNKRAYIIGE